jgi:hypothetical protein
MNKSRKQFLLWSLALVLALLAGAASRQTGAYEKTGPLFQGRVATDLNLNNVFDRSLVGTELLATNAASLAASARFSHAGESSLVKYFSKLYPNMSRQTFSAMLTLYSSLDCWYETLMPQFGAKPSVDFAADRLSSLTAVDRGRDLLWSRLSSVCDCRVALPQCRFSASKSLVECPDFPGLRVQIKANRLLQQAFDSDNATGNAAKDVIKHAGMSGLKGFPDGAWYEGLVYPSACCGDNTGFQRGLTGSSGRPLLVSNASEPWFNSTSCVESSCPDGYACVTVASDGSYGPRKKFDACLRVGSFVETFEAASDLIDDCTPAFPGGVCASVKPAHYRAFSSFPARGCGVWFTTGKTFACNTKLGYLIAPASDGGCGLSLVDVMAVRRATDAPVEQNIHAQVARLTSIIQFGSVPATTQWPALAVSDLEKHGYAGGRQSTVEAARREAEKLVAYWYVNGYTGLENGAPNGLNYSYEKYFPIGTHFSYASAFDNLILSWMATKRLDSIQFLLEPQNATIGLRPAYLFEIFSARPTTATGAAASSFSDSACRAAFSLDPSIDLSHYIRYGYIAGSLVKSPRLLDSNTMTLKAEIASFSA